MGDDFIQQNGAFLLTVLGIVSAGCTGLSVYMIRSRCTRISCLCGSCERDVVPAEAFTTGTQNV